MFSANYIYVMIKLFERRWVVLLRTLGVYCMQTVIRLHRIVRDQWAVCGLDCIRRKMEVNTVRDTSF